MENDDPLHLSENPFSLLQQNNLFVNKILSRDSSFGHSARLPDCHQPGRIPFIWEAQPGLPKYQPPKNPPSIDLPPPTAGLTPNVIAKQERVYKIRFWKKPKRSARSNVVVKKNGVFGWSSSRRHVGREGESCIKLHDKSSPSCVSYCLSRSSSLASSSNGYGGRGFKLRGLVKGFFRWAF